MFEFATRFSWNDLLFMLQGAGVTLTITFFALLGGTILGVVLGIARAGLPAFLNIPLGILLDIPKSVPLLIQFVLANSFKSIIGLDVSAFTVACTVLAIYTATYCA